MTEECPHRVHLGVGRGSVRSRTVDLLDDDRGLAHSETATPVRAWNERGEPARFAERAYEALRILPLPVDLAPVLVAEAGAELPDR